MPRRSLLAAVLVSIVVAGCGGGRPRAVTVPTPPHHARSLIVGVIANSLGAGSQMAAVQDKVNALGVDWIREELDWPTAEPEPGVFQWASFDRLFTTAAEHHLHVLPMLLGSPSWAASAPLALPSDPDAFATFAAALVHRYGPGGTFWSAHPDLPAQYAPQWFELWNEVYTTAYSTGGVDPARYAQLLVATVSAARAANPRAKWLMSTDLVYQEPGGRQGNWLAALYAAQPDLNRYFDGVAVHPYSYFSPEAGPRAGPIAERFDRIGAIESILRSHGAGDKPMWITELGWSTCDARPQCTSQHDQAQWLADAFTLVRTRYARFVRALFVYHLDDFAVAPDNREDHYGLDDLDGAHKAAWSVVHEEAELADG